MKPNLENLKEYTTKVTLSSEEKFDMFQNIRTHMNANPIRPRYSIFMRHSVVYAGMLALLIGTAGTSIAAEGALPGDILYPIKTDINEEVIKTLSFSAPQKAKVAVNRMDRRMGELEKMIVQKKDSPEKIDLIVAKLQEHKADLQDFTDQVEMSNTVEVQEATEIYATLDSVMDTHIDILEELKEKEEEHFATTTIPNTLVTGTISEATSSEPQAPDATVVLRMSSANIEATSTELAKTVPNNPEIIGEVDAVTEILNFSAGFDPLLDPENQKSEQKSEKNEEIKSDTRKKIIEYAEEELQIQVDEDTTIQIQTIIK